MKKILDAVNKLKCDPRTIIQSAVLTLITATNSFSVLFTYFDSANNFFWHVGKADGPLTQNDSEWESWDPYVLGLGTTLCVFIFLNNQISMPNHIAKLINYLCGKTVFTIENEQKPTKVSQLIEIAGSGGKAVISTSSLLASLLDLTKNWPVSLSLSGLVLAGNFGATFVVTKQHTGWRAGWPERVVKPVAWFIRLTYGGSQLVLYMNAIFNPLLLTGILKQRPGFIQTDDTGRWIAIATCYPALEFMIGSGNSMYKRALEVFGPAKLEVIESSSVVSGETTTTGETMITVIREPSLTASTETSNDMVESESEFKMCAQNLKEQTSVSSSCITWEGYEKWRGGVASGYRSIALLAAVFCFLYSWLKDIGLSAGLTSPFILAIPGVCALLYPTKESKKEERPSVVQSGHSILIINTPLLSTPLLTSNISTPGASK